MAGDGLKIYLDCCRWSLNLTVRLASGDGMQIAILIAGDGLQIYRDCWRWSANLSGFWIASISSKAEMLF